MNNTPNVLQYPPTPAGGRRYPGEVERLRVEVVSAGDGFMTIRAVDWEGSPPMIFPDAMVKDCGATEEVLKDHPPEYFKRRWRGTRSVDVDRDTFYDYMHADLFGGNEQVTT